MEIFAFGVIGTIAPELLRMWEARDHPLVRPTSFWFVSVAFALLGGVVAVLFADTNRAAFVMGVGTPFFISGITRHLAARKPDSPAIDAPPAETPEADIVVEILPGLGHASFARRVAIYSSLL